MHLTRRAVDSSQTRKVGMSSPQSRGWGLGRIRVPMGFLMATSDTDSSCSTYPAKTGDGGPEELRTVLTGAQKRRGEKKMKAVVKEDVSLNLNLMLKGVTRGGSEWDVSVSGSRAWAKSRRSRIGRCAPTTPQ